MKKLILSAILLVVVGCSNNPMSINQVFNESSASEEMPGSSMIDGKIDTASLGTLQGKWLYEQGRSSFVFEGYSVSMTGTNGDKYDGFLVKLSKDSLTYQPIYGGRLLTFIFSYRISNDTLYIKGTTEAIYIKETK